MDSTPNKGSYFDIQGERMFLQYVEAVAQRWPVKKLFLEIWQNPQ